MIKKGQGLSINVIIVAALALIVLIVLWAIFTGRMGIFVKGIKETDKTCAELGGMYKDSCGENEKAVVAKDANLPENIGKVCCIKPRSSG